MIGIFTELKTDFDFSELCLWDIEDGLCLQMNQIVGNHTGFYVSFCEIFLFNWVKDHWDLDMRNRGVIRALFENS